MRSPQAIPLRVKTLLAGVLIVFGSPLLLGLFLLRGLDLHSVDLNVPEPTACSTAIRQSIRFGAGISAVQAEGAWERDGKALNLWDVWSKKRGKIADASTPAVSTNFYNDYMIDITLMRNLGIRWFRFSISWSRLLPGAVRGSAVSTAAVQRYNQIIDELLRSHITPLVTLYHWDLPQKLQDEYGGWLGGKVVSDFEYFADACFRHFGDRIKYWFTINEPGTVCSAGYVLGHHPPGLHNATNAARCGKHMLLAHARAVALYRKTYKTKKTHDGAKLGMIFGTVWFEPFSNRSADHAAAAHALDNSLGWYADAVYFGRFPRSARHTPRMTAKEWAMVRGSNDFFAVQSLTARYVRANGSTNQLEWVNSSGAPVGTPTGHPSLVSAPWALERLLLHIHKRYNAPPIFLTAEGMTIRGESRWPATNFTRDVDRARWHHDHMTAVCQAARAGVVIDMYLVWSFTDVFEWDDGYRLPFGIVKVDHRSGGGRYRYVKGSAKWLSHHLFTVGLQDDQQHPKAAHIALDA